MPPLCLTKYHAMETHWGRGGIAPRILNLGTRQRWVIKSLSSAAPAPLRIGQEAGWAPELVWLRLREEKFEPRVWVNMLEKKTWRMVFWGFLAGMLTCSH